jgi:hydroxyacylglutathione hydrolase
MSAYLESLERVRVRAPRRIAPGHGDVIEDPAAVLDQYLRHRMEREAQVLAGLGTAKRRGVTAEQLVAAIYTDVPAALHPVARYSVWAHLRKLEDEGRAWTADRDDLDAPWLPRSEAGT